MPVFFEIYIEVGVLKGEDVFFMEFLMQGIRKATVQKRKMGMEQIGFLYSLFFA